MTVAASDLDATVADTLGAWIAGLKPSAIPAQVLSKVRDHLLDSFGAMVVGQGAVPTNLVLAVYGMSGDSVLVDLQASPIDRARILAVAAHANEIDDTEGCDHTGAVVFSSLFALLGSDLAARATGDELLTAAVAGYEVGRRMQNAFGGYDAHNSAGWHSTATCGVFAATAAACKLLRLSAADTTHALGLAGSKSGGTWAFSTDGSMAKQLHTGTAASGGVESALLAAQGFTGPRAIFDDVWGGLFRTHAGLSGAGETLLTGLGDTWHTTHSAIKMYAACRSAHPTLDGVVELLGSGRLSAENIERIEYSMSPLMEGMIGSLSPRSVESARMSLPTATALLLTGKHLLPSDFENFQGSEVQSWLNRMSVSSDVQVQGVRAHVFTTSGEIRIERSVARGSESQPFTSEEVREKFLKLTEQVLTVETQEACIAFVDGLGSGNAAAVWLTMLART